MSSSSSHSGLRFPATPFVSADNRPSSSDGKYRVVVISSGSVASIKIPDIVGALSRDPNIEVQVVATKASLNFYSQESLDNAILQAHGVTQQPDGGMVQDNASADSMRGVKIWTDEDEWSDWKKVGDPILHIELRRWADLVVVAPCSADLLAKIAGGLCDNLATSLLRALSPSTTTIICPAMNTHMYQHPLTADHMKIVQEKLNYMVSGPQGAGTLACGDEGPGKMTDWRDIVATIQDFAATHRSRAAIESGNKASTVNPSNRNAQSASMTMFPDIFKNDSTHPKPPKEIPTYALSTGANELPTGYSGSRW